MKAMRGQVLVVVALAMALTIMSVQSYLYSLSNQRIVPQNDYLSDYLLSIEQGSKHMIIASLINISNGGPSENLGSNLARWGGLLSDDYRFGNPTLTYAVETDSPYNEGLWLEWGTTGTGISSISTDFSFDLSGRSVEVFWDFNINVTSKVNCSGGYSDLGGISKQFDVTVNLYNEDASSLASSIMIQYNKTTTWENPSSLGDYSVTDYGNGTCIYSFTDDVDKIQVPIRVQVVDIRGIYVRTEYLLEEN